MFLHHNNKSIVIFFQMPILDISGSDDRRNLSRPESESDFEEIHPGQSVFITNTTL